MRHPRGLSIFLLSLATASCTADKPRRSGQTEYDFLSFDHGLPANAESGLPMLSALKGIATQEGVAEVRRGQLLLRFGPRELRDAEGRLPWGPLESTAATTLESDPIVDAQGSFMGGAVYTEIAPNVDLEIVARPRLLETHVVLHEPPSADATGRVAYVENIMVNRNAQVRSDEFAAAPPLQVETYGAFDIFVPGQPDASIHIPMPALRSADGLVPTAALRHRITLDADGQGTLETLVPMDLLRDPSLRYPLRIDPPSGSGTGGPIIGIMQVHQATPGSAGAKLDAIVTYPAGTYLYTIDWGDETSSTGSAEGSMSKLHTYGRPGTYQVCLEVCSDHQVGALCDQECMPHTAGTNPPPHGFPDPAPPTDPGEDPVPCEERGDLCNEGVEDPSGDCVIIPRPDGTICLTDNNSAGTCVTGVCIETTTDCEGNVQCDDGNPCTKDVCAGVPLTCVNVPLLDGTGCGGTDACFSGFCESCVPTGDEVCDGLDNDCDGSVDEGLSVDSDGDGHTTPGSCGGTKDDCDDTRAGVFPGSAEVCDGLDNDCDGVADDGLSTDADGDGFTAPGSCTGTANDCDDNSAARFPGAAEICDGLDNDCNGTADDGLTFDLDGDGHSSIGSCGGTQDDCDDSNSAAFTGAAELCDGIDNDCDGTADEGLTTDADGDGFTSIGSCRGTANDCDDLNAVRFPGNSEFCDGLDNDCDNVADEGLNFDLDGDGRTTPGSCGGTQDDCNDSNASVFPGAAEICDGLDNNCNGNADEGLTTDADGDGYTAVGSCRGTGNDCDDNDEDVHPGAEEVCNGEDDDCDGADDEGLSFDLDGDGHTTPGSCGGTQDDCNDSQSTVFTGSPEICDGLDNDCDGTADEGLSTDADNDGFTAIGSCRGTANDCNDTNAAIFPGATEVCDGIDNNCTGGTDEGLSVDLDGDGHTTPGSCGGTQDDCNDNSDTVFTGAPELCDGIDNDCDGVVDDALTTDADGDGFTAPGSCTGTANDCDDSNPAIYLGAPEIACDGIDNNCNGITDDDIDLDRDGVSRCDGDCDDTNANNFPGNAEVCDGLDNDCDGTTDDGIADGDGDGICDLRDRCSGDDAVGDSDGDGVCDDIDVCPGFLDTSDIDGDAVADGCDPCPLDNPDDANNNQICDSLENTGGGGVSCQGDVSSGDGDSDGICDDIDPCPLDAQNDRDGDGVCFAAGDCNDGRSDVFPNAPEQCDGIDNDCDGDADEGLSTDLDGDGYTSVGSCAGTANDCDDTDPTVFPGATEVFCDNKDQNCNGNIDDSPDLDGDGQSVCGADCDDTDAKTFSGAAEICDFKDNDCDGEVDEGLNTDNDGDGFTAIGACSGSRDDCNDDNGDVFPGAPELCDGEDNDCNGELDFGGQPNNERDADNDGVLSCGGDCDDLDEANFPGNPEICDGQDNNCNGIDDFLGFAGSETDNDVDGVSECQGDCDDADRDNFPGNPEICDGQDNDCNGIDDAGGFAGSETDNDNDGQAECAGDCNDSNSNVFTGNPESCDGIDNNCNSLADEENPATMCGSVPNATSACIGGSCVVGSCAGSFLDVDNDFSTGCECESEPLPQGLGASCAEAIDLDAQVAGGSFLDADGDVLTVTGNSAGAGSTPSGSHRSVWYTFTATDDSDTAGDEYHAAVEFLTNPGNAYSIQVFKGGCPAGGGQEFAFNEVDLFEYYTNFDKIGATGAGEGNCLTGNADNRNNCNDDTATYFVRVSRLDDTPSCDQWQVRFSNGVCPVNDSQSPACP